MSAKFLLLLDVMGEVSFSTHNYTKKGWDELPETVKDYYRGTLNGEEGVSEEDAIKFYLARNTGFSGFPYVLPKRDSSIFQGEIEISRAKAAYYIWKIKKLRASGNYSSTTTTRFRRPTSDNDEGDGPFYTENTRTSNHSWNFVYPTGGYELTYSEFGDGTEETSTGIENYDHAQSEKDLMQPQTRIFERYGEQIVRIRDRPANFAYIYYIQTGADPTTGIELNNPAPTHISGSSTGTVTQSTGDPISMTAFVAGGISIAVEVVDGVEKFWLYPPSLSLLPLEFVGLFATVDPSYIAGVEDDWPQVGTLNFDGFSWPIYGYIADTEVFDDEGVLEFSSQTTTTASATLSIVEEWDY